jgi:hypothetical protein
MFHLYITLAYILPNIYVFFRIKDLFISKGFKLLYSVVYLLIAAIYPFTEKYAEGNISLFMKTLSAVSGYILPFFLYLFLAVLVFDLFLLINLRVRIVSHETRKSFVFRSYTFTAIILLSITVVVAGAINLNTIRVSEYKAEVPRRNAKTDHLRVAFVSDFHIQQNTSSCFVEQFVKKVNALQPDIMLYGGDMVEGDSENETTVAIESVMKNIHAKYGSFGVTGNHEFYGGQEQGSFFRKAGITLLCDTVVKIDSSFYLAGRYDQHFGQRKTVNANNHPGSSSHRTPGSKPHSSKCAVLGTYS